MELAISIVPVYTHGHPAHVRAITSLYMPVLAGAVSAHRPRHDLGMCVHVGRDECGVQRLHVCLAIALCMPACGHNYVIRVCMS